MHSDLIATAMRRAYLAARLDGQIATAADRDAALASGDADLIARAERAGAEALDAAWLDDTTPDGPFPRSVLAASIVVGAICTLGVALLVLL